MITSLLFRSHVFLLAFSIAAIPSNEADAGPQELKTQVISVKNATNFPSSTPICLYPSTYYDFVRNSKFFVDNSLLIEYILRAGISGTPYLLPRRFGKSLNLLMVKAFYEIPMNGSTLEPISRNDTEAYYLFEKGILRNSDDEKIELELDKPFLITSRPYSPYMLGLRNTFPVVYLNFSHPPECRDLDTADKIYKFLKERIIMSFKQHEYLSRLTARNVGEYSYFNRTLASMMTNTTDSIFITNSVISLSSDLQRFFDKGVVYLIDEYDSVLNKVHFGCSGFSEEYKRSVTAIFAGFIGNILKSNPYLGNAVLTGTVTWTCSGMFSQFGIHSSISITDEEPMNYYGIDPEHVKEMLRLENINETQYETIDKKYGGFVFGKKNVMKKLNPFSIAEYFAKHNSNSYRKEPDDISYFLRILLRYSNFHELFLSFLFKFKLQVDADSSYSLEIPYFDKNSMSTILIEGDTLEKNEWYKYDCSSPLLAIDFLFMTGYLTISENRTKEYILFQVPNEEIERSLWNIYYTILADADPKDSSGLNLSTKMKNCSTECWKLITTNETDCTRLANSFHSILLELSSSSKDQYLYKKLIEALVLVAHFQNTGVISFAELSNYTEQRVSTHETGFPNFAVSYNGLVTVIEFKSEDQCVDGVLEQMKRYKTIYKNHTDVDSIKTIGFFIRDDGSVNVAARMKSLKDFTF